MKNNGFTLIELVVYIFILSFLGFLVFLLTNNFFSYIENSKKVVSFSKSYNDFVNYSYSKLYNDWLFESNEKNDVILYNSGDITGYSGYIGYDCYSTGIGVTYMSTNKTGINWDNFQKTFTGINCTSISGRKSERSYWLDINISIEKRPMELNLFYNK